MCYAGFFFFRMDLSSCLMWIKWIKKKLYIYIYWIVRWEQTQFNIEHFHGRGVASVWFTANDQEYNSLSKRRDRESNESNKYNKEKNNKKLLGSYYSIQFRHKNVCNIYDDMIYMKKKNKKKTFYFSTIKSLNHMESIQIFEIIKKINNLHFFRFIYRYNYEIFDE